MAKSVDEQVMDMLRKVEAKKAEIKAAEQKPRWITTGSLGLSDSVHDKVSIITTKDSAVLMNLYSFLLMKEEYLERSAKEMGLAFEPAYQGFKISDWQADLKTRAAQLSIENKKKELALLDKRVNGLVSPDQRRAMELEALSKELGE